MGARTILNNWGKGKGFFLSAAHIGPVLRKAPSSRKVDKCGTVFVSTLLTQFFGLKRCRLPSVRKKIFGHSTTPQITSRSLILHHYHIRTADEQWYRRDGRVAVPMSPPGQ